MRALWSQVTFSCFFHWRDGPFGKWTFLKMSKIDLRKTNQTTFFLIFWNMYEN
jgi:hypothetical protein